MVSKAETVFGSATPLPESDQRFTDATHDASRDTAADTQASGTLPQVAERRSLLSEAGTAGAPGQIPTSLPQANYGAIDANDN